MIYTAMCDHKDCPVTAECVAREEWSARFYLRELGWRVQAGFAPVTLCPVHTHTAPPGTGVRHARVLSEPPATDLTERAKHVPPRLAREALHRRTRVRKDANQHP
jgi:hypothetical protein